MPNDVPVVENDTVTMELVGQKELPSPFTIVKSNPLITSSYNLTLNGMKLLNVALAKINPFEEVPPDKGLGVFIPIRELKQALGVKGNSIYSQVKRAVFDLSNNNTFYFEGINEEGMNLGFYVLIEKAHYIERRGVEIKFAPSVTPFLTNLQRKGIGFTVFSSTNTIPMRSKYSMKMYEMFRKESFLLRKLASKNSVVVEIDECELRFKLGIYDLNDSQNNEAKILMSQGCKDYEKIMSKLKGKDKNKYKQTYALREKVIDVAQKEIRELTDIDFEYEEVGGYGRPKKYVFTIFRNTRNHQNMLEIRERAQKMFKYDEKDMERINDIIEYVSDTYDLKVSDARAVAECAGYDLHIIDEAGQLLNNANNVRNVTGWLIECIRQNWAGMGTVESQNAYIEESIIDPKAEVIEEEVLIESLP